MIYFTCIALKLDIISIEYRSSKDIKHQLKNSDDDPYKVRTKNMYLHPSIDLKYYKYINQETCSAWRNVVILHYTEALHFEWLKPIGNNDFTYNQPLPTIVALPPSPPTKKNQKKSKI